MAAKGKRSLLTSIQSPNPLSPSATTMQILALSGQRYFFLKTFASWTSADIMVEALSISVSVFISKPTFPFFYAKG